MSSRSLANQVAAFQLTIECLPKPALWQSAIRARRDDTTPEGVFSIIDHIRMRLHARLGQLTDSAATSSSDIFRHDAEHQRICSLAGAKNVDAAYLLVVGSLPRRDAWQSAFNRENPAMLREIFGVVNRLRMRLHVLYGDWRASGVAGL